MSNAKHIPRYLEDCEEIEPSSLGFGESVTHLAIEFDRDKESEETKVIQRGAAAVPSPFAQDQPITTFENVTSSNTKMAPSKGNTGRLGFIHTVKGGIKDGAAQLFNSSTPIFSLPSTKTTPAPQEPAASAIAEGEEEESIVC